MDSRWDLIILDRDEKNTATFTGPFGTYSPVLSGPPIIDLQSEKDYFFGFERCLVTITAESPGSTVITCKSSDGDLYEVLVIVL